MNVGGWVRRIFGRAEPEDRMSVMPAWAIWIGGLAVLVVGALSGWLLLSRFGAGTAQDRVQLEILRLTGSIALGSGGAVALLLAARRQRATEVDIVQKKQATEDARHDATERRVTELYTKAAEQLGSDKAAVRLAGLYALERLAQDNPDHRPTIVEVICAYLRMPYTPPSTEASSEVRSHGRSRRHRGLRPPNRRNTTPSPMRTINTLASTLSGVVDPAQDQHQELQVRLAAQRVLTTHLRPERDEQGRPTNQRFWHNVSIDFTGANLVDWDMSWCEVDSAIFDDTTFHGGGRFSAASFQGFVRFRMATFEGPARFDGATFQKPTRFDEATFLGHAWFGGATFQRIARFNEANFRRVARFEKVNFHSSGLFDRVIFCGLVRFERAVFHEDAVFNAVTFQESAMFDRATFHGRTTFDAATFHEAAGFSRTNFYESAGFGGVAFQGPASFWDATYGSGAVFLGATFQCDVADGPT